MIQAHNIGDRDGYLHASRRGLGTRLNRPQRAAVWQVFEEYRRLLVEQGKLEWFDLVRQAREYLAAQGDILPYRAIVVDETQDLHPEELRLLRQMVRHGPNDLFFVGDAHQRIYGRPVVMSQCGIEIRGRSSKLRVNYRTTQEIQAWAMRVLTGQPIDDLDGGSDSPVEYMSLMHGVEPEVCHFTTMEEEREYLVAELADLLSVTPGESICVVARAHWQLHDVYLPALRTAGIPYLYLQANTSEYAGSGVRLATMHRVKGLEFPHVRLVGVNRGVIPYVPETEDLDAVAQDEAELRERCLLHVAASRARNTLIVTGYGAPSPFVAEM